MLLRPKLFVTGLLALLTACATTATVPLPAQYKQPTTLYAISSVTATTHMSVGLSGAGSGFGLLGGLIESGGTAGSREAMRQKLTAAVGSWRAEDVIRDTFDAELRRQGRRVIAPQQITPLPPALAAEVKGDDSVGRIATIWYNPDKTVLDHSALIRQYHPGVILEVGYQGYELSQRSNVGWFVNITMIVKAIRPDTGEVIGRARNFIVAAQNQRGVIGKYDLNDERQIKPFVDRFKTVFAQEVAGLSKESLDKLGL